MLTEKQLLIPILFFTLSSVTPTDAMDMGKANQIKNADQKLTDLQQELQVLNIADDIARINFFERHAHEIICIQQCGDHKRANYFITSLYRDIEKRLPEKSNLIAYKIEYQLLYRIICWHGIE